MYVGINKQTQCILLPLDWLVITNRITNNDIHNRYRKGTSFKKNFINLWTNTKMSLWRLAMSWLSNICQICNFVSCDLSRRNSYFYRLAKWLTQTFMQSDGEETLLHSCFDSLKSAVMGCCYSICHKESDPQVWFSKIYIIFHI